MNEKMSLIEKAEVFLKKNKAKFDSSEFDDIKEILEKLNLYHAELMIQNEELREAKLKTEEKEEKYRNLYDFAPICFLTVTSNGIIEEINLTGAKIFGLSRKQLVRQRFSQFIHNEDEENYHRCVIETKKNKNDVNCELRISGKNGKIIFVLLKMSPQLSENEVNSIRIALTDITEKRQIERELRKNEKKMQEVLRNYPNGTVYLFDTKYRFLMAEGEELKEHGFTKEELVGRTLTEVYPRDLAFHKMKFLDGVWRNNKIEFEYKFKGEVYLAAAAPLKNEDGIINQIIVITQKITELKNIEELAKKNEQRYRSLFEFSSDPTLIIENGVFVEINDATQQFLGYKDSSELIGKSPAYISPKYQPDGKLSEDNAKEKMKEAVDKGHTRFEWLHTKKDGSEVWVDVALTSIDQENNERIYTVWRDITETKRAQLALEKSEEKFRIFMDHLPAGIFIKDEEGRYVFLNKYNEEKFGSRDWYGKTAHDFFSIETANRFDEEDKKVLTNGSINSSISVVDKEGKRHHFKTQFFPIENRDGGKLIGGISLDITDEVKMREALEASEEKYRNIFENSALGIFRSTPEGRYQLVNKAFAQILGFESPEKMIETVDDIRKLYKDPKDRERIEKKFAKQGFVEDFVVEGNHPTKETVWISINGASHLDSNGEVFFEGTIQDITEKKILNERLKESKEEISRILENSLDGILLTSPDGSVYSANPAACEMFGRTEKEICEIGREGVVDLSDPNLKKFIKTRRAKGKAEGEINLLRKDGTKFPAEVSSALFTGKDGELKSSMIIRDITDRKKAEEELIFNRNYLNSLFSASPIGIGVVKNRKFDFVNSVFCQMIEYSKNELLGNDSAIIYPSKDEYERVGRVKYENIYKTGIGTVDTKFKTKSGIILDVILSSAPIDETDLSKGVTFTALDISERKRAEEELKTKMAELERFNKAMVGRENKMIELKKEINELCGKLSLPERYSIVEE